MQKGGWGCNERSGSAVAQARAFRGLTFEPFGSFLLLFGEVLCVEMATKSSKAESSGGSTVKDYGELVVCSK